MMIPPIGGQIDIDAGALFVPVLINHYSGVESVSWHVRIQITTHDDPTFAARITALDKDSNADQTGWFWRDDQINATGRTFTAIAAGGMATLLSKQQSNGLVATAMFAYTAASELAKLTWGRTYLVRAAQYNGAVWGDWSSWAMRAGQGVSI